MIAVDTSALITVLLREPGFEECIAALSENADALISAGTLSETRIVATQRSVGPQLTALLHRKKFSVIAVTEATSERIGQIYARWGKGLHPAGLNLGDCFAYDVAKEHSCPLLFVGNDFSRTDIKSAI